MEPDGRPAETEFRRRAEDLLDQGATPPASGGGDPEELQRLLHEMQVYQVELELQNQELRASRAQVEDLLNRYTDLYDFSPLGFLTLAPDGTIRQANLAGGKLLGVERAVLQSGQRFQTHVAKEDRARFDEFLGHTFAEGASAGCELRLLKFHGAEITVQMEARCTADRQACHAVFFDITARKCAERRLELAASVFTHAREGIMILGADGTVADVNAAFTRITGYERAEVVGVAPPLLDPELNPGLLKEIIAALESEGTWSGEISDRHRTGDEYAVLSTVTAVRDATGGTLNFVALFTDITRMKEHQRQLEHMVRYDPLTHLPNRMLLSDRLEQAMTQCQRHTTSVAVAYIDLDGFKAVNDQHGHHVGDQLLVSLAQRMKAALREGDTLARLGGDEFVAVLVDLDHTWSCFPILHRLLQAASLPIHAADQELSVSASMGVTFFPQDNVAPDQLMRHADQAMYQAKQAGRNRYHLFDVVHDQTVRNRSDDLEEIRTALRRGEFVLHYQPKINMRTGDLIGAEALIRWRHPERGLLMPADFLPVLDDHPLSVDMGEWVLSSVLAQMSAWQGQGRPIPVSVNISPRQLQQNAFVARLQSLLGGHPELSPHSLELEVLETTALEDIGRVTGIMKDCAALGVRFALDDFGTGYSSLTYLKHLPAAILKIDRSFVIGMLEDRDDRAIVEAVIGLVRAFGREVIAEGVETPAHGKKLLAMGCELAQGYGIAFPMPAAETWAWITNWLADGRTRNLFGGSSTQTLH